MGIPLLAVCCVSKMFSHLNGNGDFWKTEAFPSVTITHGHRCRPQGVAMTRATEEKVRVKRTHVGPEVPLGWLGQNSHGKLLRYCTRKEKVTVSVGFKLNLTQYLCCDRSGELLGLWIINDVVKLVF